MKKSLLLASALLVGAITSQAAEARIYLHGGPEVLPENSMAIPVGNNDDPIVSHFYIWDNTFQVVNETDSEVGMYGNWVIGNVGWWGVGYNAPVKYPAGATEATAGVDFTPVTYDWNLHFKLKTDLTGNITIGLMPDLNTGTAEKLELVVNTSTIKTVDGTAPVFDGTTWNEIEVPMSYFFDKFTSEAAAIDAFCAVHHDCNWLTFVGGNEPGKAIAVHDMYLHGEGVIGGTDTPTETPDEDSNSDIYRIYLHGGPEQLPGNSMAIPVGNNDDPIVSHFYIWNNTFQVVSETDSEVGMYGNWVIGNVGWWGVGYNAPVKYPAGATEATAGVDFTPVTYDWSLHFKLKTDLTGNITIGLMPDLNTGTAEKLELVVNTSTIKTVDGTAPVFDGATWNEINVPMSYFFDKFTSEAAAIDAFCAVHHDCNWLTFVGGNEPGKSVAFHDMYLHNGMEVGAIDDVVVDQLSIEISGNVVKAEKAEIYNLQGIKVMEVDGEASIDALAKGVYVVRAANGDVVKIAR